MLKFLYVARISNFRSFLADFQFWLQTRRSLLSGWIIEPTIYGWKFCDV
jgi:hypothetical protein